MTDPTDPTDHEARDANCAMATVYAAIDHIEGTRYGLVLFMIIAGLVARARDVTRDDVSDDEMWATLRATYDSFVSRRRRVVTVKRHD